MNISTLTESGVVSPNRAEIAAAQISRAARELPPGSRLGSRAELKELCNVSVGTLHEALRLLQSTREITVRTGPGGGIFVGESSALSDLVRSFQTEGSPAPTYPEVAWVLNALSPLIIEDAIAALDSDSKNMLIQHLRALHEAAQSQLRDVVRATLEVFARIASIPSGGILRTIAGSILRLQMDMLRTIDTPIDATWRKAVDNHVEGVTLLVTAIIESDIDNALAVRTRPGFTRLFEMLAQERRGRIPD